MNANKNSEWHIFKSFARLLIADMSEKRGGKENR
jgi:hypothetical protein